MSIHKLSIAISCHTNVLSTDVVAALQRHGFDVLPTGALSVGKERG